MVSDLAVEQLARALLRSIATGDHKGCFAELVATLERQGGVVIVDGRTLVKRDALVSLWAAVQARAGELLADTLVPAAAAKMAAAADVVEAELVAIFADAAGWPARDFPIRH